MANKSSSMSLLCVCFLLHLLLVKSRSPLAPALYVFGDSLIDSGNNNYLKTKAKVNYKPYGIDFPLGATGRFTNGKTSVDFIAELLGLPYVPAYWGLSNADKIKITTGVNYGSGSAGILPETGRALGNNLCMDDQIKFFDKTVSNDLPNIFKTQDELSLYLSKSIVLICIGSNDYLNNYLQPAVYNSSKTYDPLQFGSLLLDRLKQQVMKLYNLGARKFVVFGIGPIGCLPAVVNGMNPKPITPCAEDVNKLVLTFNFGLPGVILELFSTLHGSTFVLGDIYKTSYLLNQNPILLGFTAGQAPCCVVGGEGVCLPDQTPCPDRNKHIYWDAFHPTEALNSGVAIACFSGTSVCSPMNIQQLALIP